MDNLLVQSGVVGIFAILVIREILNFFGKRSDNDDSNFPTWLRLQLQQAVTQLSKDMQSQTDMMREIKNSLDKINQTLFGISGEYEKIKDNLDHIGNSLQTHSERRSKSRGNGN